MASSFWQPLSTIWTARPSAFLPRFCGRICTSTTRGWAGWPDSRSVTSAVGVRPAGGDGIGKLACSHPHYRSYHGTPRTSVRQWPPDAVLCRPRSELRQAEESPQPQAWSSSVKSGGQTAGMSTLCHYVTMNALSVLLPLKKGAARIDGGREAPRLSFTLDVGTTTTPEGFAFFPPFLHGGTLGTQSVTFLPSTNPRAAPTSSINSARYPCLSSPLPASARSSTLPRVAFPL